MSLMTNRPWVHDVDRVGQFEAVGIPGGPQRAGVQVNAGVLRAQNLLDLEAVLVHRAMVAPAEQHQIRQRRRPAGRPVPNMMALREAQAAAWEAATAVSMLQRPA